MKMSSNPIRIQRLTLVELMVVLLIVVTLTTIAIRTTEGLLDQSRFQATQILLREIEDAVLGKPNFTNTDGSLIINGFVADIGRLPEAVGDSNTPLTQLSELWERPAGLQEYTIDSPIVDNEVLMGTGWNGPYLRLPIGASKLTDGWGNALNFFLDNQDTAEDGDRIAVITSFGADNELGSGGLYDSDVSIVFHSTAPPTIAQRFVAVITGSISPISPSNESDSMVVRYYGPNPDDGSILTIETDAFDIEDTAPQSYEFNGFDDDRVTIGPRVLRAYQYDDDSLTTLRGSSSIFRLVMPKGPVFRDMTILEE